MSESIINKQLVHFNILHISYPVTHEFILHIPKYIAHIRVSLHVFIYNCSIDHLQDFSKNTLQFV